MLFQIEALPEVSVLRRRMEMYLLSFIEADCSVVEVLLQHPALQNHPNGIRRAGYVDCLVILVNTDIHFGFLKCNWKMSLGF